MARLEIDIVAKNTSGTVGAINATANALSSLEKKYADAKSALGRLHNESAQLQRDFRGLQSSLNSGTISQSRFNSESARLSSELSKVGGSIQKANARIFNLKATIDQTSNSTRSFGNATKQLQGYSNDFTSGIRSANAVSVEFSRIIQDAPYGMQGVANNLQQLTQNWSYYTRAAQEAASAQGKTVTTGALLRGALGSLLSPINLLTLGISIATAGWVAYEKWQQKAKKATKENTDELQKITSGLNNVSTALYNASKASGAELSQLRLLYQASTDASRSTDDRRIAAQQLIDKYPDLFGKMTSERIMLGEAKVAYDTLSTSILATARAQAVYARIAEKASEQLAVEETNKELEKQIQNAQRLQDIEKKRYEDQLKNFRAAGSAGTGSSSASLANSDVYYQKQINDLVEEKNKNLKISENIQENILELEKEALKYQKDVILDPKKPKTDTSLKKREQDVIDSNNRIAVIEKEGRDADIERTEQWYQIRLNRAIKGSQDEATLIENKRKEISEINKKWDDKELSDGLSFMQKRQENLAKQGLKNSEQIKKDGQKETEISIQYQRRLFQSRAQISIQELNRETKIREEALDQWRKDEIEAGRDTLEFRSKLAEESKKIQEDYYKEIEKLSGEQRALDIVTSFDGTATSMSLASINDQMAQLKLSFEAGAISGGEFLDRISDLSLQKEQLGVLQSSIDGISDSFGNLFGDVLFDGENAVENLQKSFQNLTKSIVSELVKIAIRQVLNAALAKGTLASTLVASTVAAKATSAAWATPAALVSAATFGANAAAGGIALTALIATTKAVSLAGFAQGGYTGNMGVNDIAGFVHGQEYVFNATATKRIGAGNLAALERGDVSASGISPMSSARISTSPQRVDVVVHGEISGDTIKLVMDKANRDFNRYYG